MPSMLVTLGNHDFKNCIHDTLTDGYDKSTVQGCGISQLTPASELGNAILSFLCGSGTKEGTKTNPINATVLFIE